MATERARRRKPAEPQKSRTIKTSVVVGVDLHARWSAAASLRGMDRNAFAVEVLTEALRGLVIIDRRSSHDRGGSSDEVNRTDAA